MDADKRRYKINFYSKIPNIQNNKIGFICVNLRPSAANLLFDKNPLRLVRNIRVIDVHVDNQLARTGDGPFAHYLRRHRSFISFSKMGMLLCRK